MSAICRIVAVCGLVLLPAVGWAQSWEVEVHGGGAFVNNLGGGTAGALPPATPFTTLFGDPSRRVSSWYFGDGAAFLNDVLFQFGTPERITPLDPVLGSRFGERGHGGGFGVRVARAVSARFGAEFNLDFTSAPVNPTDRAMAGIEATSDSFVPALTDGLIAPGPFFNINGSSEAEVRGGAGHQVAATGALIVNLRTSGRLIPYATAGGGVIVNRGEMPSASIDGAYSFDLLGFAPLAETDHVEVRHVADDHMVVGLVGGGVKALLTRNSGIRADVRMHLGQHTARTLVSARPGSVQNPDLLTQFVIATSTSPSLQFSNTSVLAPTALSGPAVTDVETFKADGLFRQVLVSVGYFWRF